MNPTEIIEQCTDNGLTLTITDDGNLAVIGSQDWIDIWAPILRENKSAILSELEPLQYLHPCKLCTPLEAGNVTETLLKRIENSKYSVTVTDASADPVLVDITIHGQASFTIEIPKPYYDGMALLELLEQHNAQAAETHSVMSGLSNETQGIDSRRAA